MTEFLKPSFSVSMPGKNWPEDWDRTPTMNEVDGWATKPIYGKSVVEMVEPLPSHLSHGMNLAEAMNPHAELEGYLAKIEAHQKAERNNQCPLT